MRIGLLSDTHNHSGNLVRALNILRAEGIDQIFHLGDVTSPQTAAHLAGFKVIHVSGNMDRDPEMPRRLIDLNPRNESRSAWTGTLHGVAMAATHGHLAGTLESWVRSGQYRYVLHGHTHRRRDQQAGQTRIINPGALGGTRHEARSFCILDLASDALQVIEVAAW